MKFACSECGKTLSVPDNSAGRKARCPACQQVVTIPPAVPDSAMEAVSRTKPPPVPISAAPVLKPRPLKSCPTCGELLTASADSCAECGWTGLDDAVQTTPGRGRALENGGYCYVMLTRDPVELEAAIRRQVEDYLESEQIDLELSDEDPPEELSPHDVLIGGKVVHHDYGSRFIRYWLTFIAWFGPGSCKLEADLNVEDGRGDIREVPFKARQVMGLFGGNSEAMMSLNVKIVSQKAAAAMARQITGNRFLNRQVYQFALASFILGLISLVPFLGLLLGVIGLGLGMPAFILIQRRRLPKRKGLAIAGLVLNALGIVISLVLIAQNHRFL